MADAHVLTLLGVSPAPADARDALSSLAAGERVAASGGPELPGAETWLRISALPTLGGVPGPLRAVLASAGGGLAEYTTVIQHTEAGGIGLYLSGGTRACGTGCVCNSRRTPMWSPAPGQSRAARP